MLSLRNLFDWNFAKVEEVRSKKEWVFLELKVNKWGKHVQRYKKPLWMKIKSLCLKFKLQTESSGLVLKSFS